MGLVPQELLLRCRFLPVDDASEKGAASVPSTNNPIAKIILARIVFTSLFFDGFWRHIEFHSQHIPANSIDHQGQPCANPT